MKRKRSAAAIFTEAMATWRFIFALLLLCIFEIWWNHTSLIPTSLKFDDTMLTLNTLLSLWAAVQGSIIMIDNRYADKKRDQLLAHINTIVTRLDKLEKERKNEHH